MSQIAALTGMINWQHRIWLCLTEFNKIRLDEKISISSDEKFKAAENHLFQSRNLEICHATENFKNSQFSLAIKDLQSLSDELRVSQASELTHIFQLKILVYYLQRTPKDVVKHSPEYETTLANFIIMLAPIAPHFASELWSKLLTVPNRCEPRTTDVSSLEWTKDVLEQAWPSASKNFQYWLDIRVRNFFFIADILSCFHVKTRFVSILKLDSVIFSRLMEKR